MHNNSFRLLPFSSLAYAFREFDVRSPLSLKSAALCKVLLMNPQLRAPLILTILVALALYSSVPKEVFEYSPKLLKSFDKWLGSPTGKCKLLQSDQFDGIVFQHLYFIKRLQLLLRGKTNWEMKP